MDSVHAWSSADTEHCIAEDQLWVFLGATQADTLKKLTDDYGTDAREEVFRALRKELEHTPLWMILRHGLKVRGLEFRLYYPKPRSTESAAARKHGENRITFRLLIRGHIRPFHSRHNEATRFAAQCGQ